MGPLGAGGLGVRLLAVRGGWHIVAVSPVNVVKNKLCREKPAAVPKEEQPMSVTSPAPAAHQASSQSQTLDAILAHHAQLETAVAALSLIHI